MELTWHGLSSHLRGPMGSTATRQASPFGPPQPAALEAGEPEAEADQPLTPTRSQGKVSIAPRLRRNRGRWGSSRLHHHWPSV
jgi:hypothetical protein